jgi:hypothetical protein
VSSGKNPWIDIFVKAVLEATGEQPAKPSVWAEADRIAREAAAKKSTSTDGNKFKVGDKVVKPNGYPFPGEVVASFRTRQGNERYVVESLFSPGMLHIFSATQLEKA